MVNIKLQLIVAVFFVSISSFGQCELQLAGRDPKTDSPILRTQQEFLGESDTALSCIAQKIDTSLYLVVGASHKRPYDLNIGSRIVIYLANDSALTLSSLTKVEGTGHKVTINGKVTWAT